MMCADEPTWRGEAPWPLRRHRARVECGSAPGGRRFHAGRALLGITRRVAATGTAAPRARHLVRGAAEPGGQAARPAARRAALGVVLGGAAGHRGARG